MVERFVVYRNTKDERGRPKQEIVDDIVVHTNKLAGGGYNQITYRNVIDKNGARQELVSDIVVFTNKLAKGYNEITYRNTKDEKGRPKQELVDDIVVYEC